VKPPGHDYNSLIARAVDALHINVRDTRLMLYEQARRAQRSSFDPEIPEAEFGRERTALEKAIRNVETKAAAADEGQAKSDRKIVSDYVRFMVEASARLDCFYDASQLPQPKEAIIAAIEREIVRSPLEKQVESLQTASALMWNFLEGIGPVPRPLEGYSRLPRRHASRPRRAGANGRQCGIHSRHREDCEPHGHREEGGQERRGENCGSDSCSERSAGRVATRVLVCGAIARIESIRQFF
jgi:hypothetical protein